MLTKNNNKSSKAGFISVIALLMLFIFVTLSLSIASMTDLELQKANNIKLILDAQLTTESGLEYATHLLKSLEFTGGASISAVLDSLAAALSDELDGQALLQGELVAYDGNTIYIPPISLGEGKSFRAELVAANTTELQLRVFGQSSTPDGTVERTASLNAELGASGSVDEYGIYSKGSITIEHGFELWGANFPEEGSIMSTASVMAIEIDSGYIDGDVATSDPNASVDIDGVTVNGQILSQVDVVAPVIDVSVFESYANNIVDGNTNTSSGTFTNVRILAGTNPSFGSVTIKGVMYIEAPNTVAFTNNVDITGVIVSEDHGGAADGNHYVYFNNNLSVNGMEELPDTTDGNFDQLRTMAGSAFILPGFTLEFKNNFTSVSGHIAADQIIAKNNLVGTIYGSFIVLGDGGLTLKNNGNLTIDNSKYGGGTTAGVIPGGTALKKLSFVPDTYTED